MTAARRQAGSSDLRLQATVFAPVCAAFSNIYVTQPVLPVLQAEFASDLVTVSLTVSMVVLGIALANLPFGSLADRVPIQPVVLTGGAVVALAGLVCALTHDLRVLIGARFLQGLFIPALTTTLAAHLARTLPADRLGIAMGSYISATVLGGLGGRLLGGWLHPPLHWRYAFVSAAAFVVVATTFALRWLPRGPPAQRPRAGSVGFLSLLRRWDLLRLYLCAAGSFAVFSSVFNYLPFRLAGPPFALPTGVVTLVYLVYVIGIFMGPTAGRLGNRYGTGNTLLGGVAVLAGSLLLILAPSITAVVAGLVGVCAGFFTVHAGAVGALNRKLSQGQGRANALYVLFYYGGGWLGITMAGFAYDRGGWAAVIALALCLLAVPLAAGVGERRPG